MAELNLQIADSALDGEWDGTTWNPRTGTYASHEYFRVGEQGGTDWSGALRFSGVTISQGATVSAATLTVRVSGTETGSGNLTIRVHAHDADDASALSASFNPGTNWTDTTASADTVVDSTVQDRTWDVTTIVQEILDRVSWSSGNAIAFAMRHVSATYRSVRIADYDTDTTAVAARLDITYTESGSSIGDLVQSTQNSGGTATLTLDSAPTSGNLLIYGTVSGNSGVTLSTPPSGFTEITSHTSADYSSWWGYKVSDGSETSRSHAWSAGNGYSFYAEYYWQEGTPRLQSNEDTSNVTADGTGPQSSGSATPDDLTTNLCLAFITSRFQPSSDGSGAFSNSYNADISFVATPTIAGTAIASLANASGSTSSSYSWSDSGIDTYGAIAAFSPPGAGGGGLLPLLNAYYS